MQASSTLLDSNDDDDDNDAPIQFKCLTIDLNCLDWKKEKKKHGNRTVVVSW